MGTATATTKAPIIRIAEYIRFIETWSYDWKSPAFTAPDSMLKLYPLTFRSSHLGRWITDPRSIKLLERALIKTRQIIREALDRASNTYRIDNVGKLHADTLKMLGKGMACGRYDHQIEECIDRVMLTLIDYHNTITVHNHHDGAVPVDKIIVSKQKVSVENTLMISGGRSTSIGIVRPETIEILKTYKLIK